MKDLRSELCAQPALLREVYRAVEPAWPKEGCGFLFRRAEGDLHVLPTINRADALHRMDPETYPRGGEDWFEPDMKPWLRAVREGEQPVLIFHSHPDVGAYFSEWDQKSAVLEGSEGVVERHPGVWHLVVSVRDPGNADESALFEFCAEAGEFVERARFDAQGVHVGA